MSKRPSDSGLANVCLMAVKSLTKGELRQFLALLLTETALHEEILDAAVVIQRHGDNARPLNEYLASRKPKRTRRATA